MDFLSVFDQMRQHGDYHIIVGEDIKQKRIVVSGTLLIERKFIHQGLCVGHIEDIVVDEKHRKTGLGKVLIDLLLRIAVDNDCYKTILDCSDSNIPFYQKCGLKRSSNCMAIYM